MGSTSTPPSHSHQGYPTLPTNHQHQPTDLRISHPSSQPPLRLPFALISPTNLRLSPHPNAHLPLDLEPGHRHPTAPRFPPLFLALPSTPATQAAVALPALPPPAIAPARSPLEPSQPDTARSTSHHPHTRRPRAAWRGRRRCWGGRAQVRRALSMAALTATRHNPPASGPSTSVSSRPASRPRWPSSPACASCSCSTTPAAARKPPGIPPCPNP